MPDGSATRSHPNSHNAGRPGVSSQQTPPASSSRQHMKAGKWMPWLDDNGGMQADDAAASQSRPAHEADIKNRVDPRPPGAPGTTPLLLDKDGHAARTHGGMPAVAHRDQNLNGITAPLPHPRSGVREWKFVQAKYPAPGNSAHPGTTNSRPDDQKPQLTFVTETPDSIYEQPSTSQTGLREGHSRGKKKKRSMYPASSNGQYGMNVLGAGSFQLSVRPNTNSPAPRQGPGLGSYGHGSNFKDASAQLSVPPGWMNQFSVRPATVPGSRGGTVHAIDLALNDAIPWADKSCPDHEKPVLLTSDTARTHMDVHDSFMPAMHQLDTTWQSGYPVTPYIHAHLQMRYTICRPGKPPEGALQLLMADTVHYTCALSEEGSKCPYTTTRAYDIRLHTYQKHINCKDHTVRCQKCGRTSMDNSELGRHLKSRRDCTLRGASSKKS